MWQVNCLGPFPLGKGEYFVFSHLLDMDLPSLPTIILSKIPSIGLQNALFTFMVFQTASLPTKELIS